MSAGDVILNDLPVLVEHLAVRIPRMTTGTRFTLVSGMLNIGDGIFRGMAKPFRSHVPLLEGNMSSHSVGSFLVCFNDHHGVSIFIEVLEGTIQQSVGFTDLLT